MSEDDLKNLKELESKNKPRILTMYFEDGGEASVVLYDDYEDIQQQLKQRDEVIEKIVSQVWYMQNNEPSNSNEYDFYCRKLICIATQKGDKNGN